MKDKEIKISHLTPMLPVRDMEKTLDYYDQMLGFSNIWRWDEPTTVANARRADCAFLFSLDAQMQERCKGLEIMVFVHGIKSLWTEYQGKDIEVVDRLEKKPWDLWEFQVRDINGYILRFGEGS